jgi:hypothetical protein
MGCAAKDFLAKIYTKSNPANQTTIIGKISKNLNHPNFFDNPSNQRCADLSIL